MRPTLLALVLVLLGGCARVHYTPAPAPDDAGAPAPSAPQCVRWWAEPGFPEYVRCVEWAADGCTLEPFYHVGDPVRCVSRSEGRDR